MPRFNVVAMQSTVYSVEAPDAETAEQLVQRAVGYDWDVQPAERDDAPISEPDLRAPPFDTAP